MLYFLSPNHVPATSKTKFIKNSGRRINLRRRIVYRTHHDLRVIKLMIGIMKKAGEREEEKCLFQDAMPEGIVDYLGVAIKIKFVQNSSPMGTDGGYTE